MDILEMGRKLAEEHCAGLKGKKNAYECEVCHSYIITVDRDAGVTPFLAQCGNCGGTAQSKLYRVNQGLTPTHEWYRPENLDGIEAGSYEHLSKGGLLRRPAPGATGLWVRQTIRSA